MLDYSTNTVKMEDGKPTEPFIISIENTADTRQRDNTFLQDDPQESTTLDIEQPIPIDGGGTDTHSRDSPPPRLNRSTPPPAPQNLISRACAWMTRRRLRFEREIQPEYRPPSLPARAAGMAKTAAVLKLHGKIHKSERQNVAVEATHKSELFAEQGAGRALRWEKSRRRTKPYRTLRHAEQKVAKEHINLAWQIVRAVAQFAAARKSLLAVVALLALTVVFFSAGLTSCTAMFSAFQSSYISASYMANE